MKKIIFLISILVTSLAVAKEVKLPQDPFDLSASTSKVKELGVVTKEEVDTLELKSKELFNKGECKQAIPVLIEYSKKSNWLANMISATLDPYYGAKYDDRKSFPYEKIKPLIPLENMANKYKQKRNIAFAMQGECLIKIGNTKEAVPVLLKTLDLISLDNEVWWARTRTNLLSVIHVEVEGN